MYDAGKVIPGLIVFLGLLTIPVWYNAGTGMSDHEPKLDKPKGESCIESAEYMRAHHMELLNDWRDRVVRDGERYIEIGGVQWEMSLTNTCMKCHDNKAGFCEQCHDYLGVAPYCWDCHLTPEVLEQ
jgi:hypothetical protein